MDLVLANKQFAVFDNVLSDKDFNLVWYYIQSEDYQFVHQFRWQKVYRLCDGHPLETMPVFSEAIPGIDPSRIRVYPTNTGFDIIFKFILDNSQRLSEWIGVRGMDWEVMSAKAFLFPKGSALSWHSDHNGRTGSFTFYAHPEWNIQWGGELLIADESVKDLRHPKVERYGLDNQKRINSQLDNYFENEKLFEFGIGQYVLPKPNRLVVIAGGNLHRINNSESAGDRVRCSISGFFVQKSKPDKQTDLNANAPTTPAEKDR